MTPPHPTHEIEGSAQMGRGRLAPEMADDLSPELDINDDRADPLDEILRAHLPVRRWRVAVEETALCPVEIHNAGKTAADFRVTVLGADGEPLDEAWVRMTPAQVHLPPEGRSSIILALTPPRSPHSRAGDHDLIVQVTSPQRPERCSRISAVLTVNPFAQLQIDPPVPAQVGLSWRVPVADFVLPVENRGNHEVSLGLGLGVADGGRTLVAAFEMGGGGDRVALGPGRRRHLPVRIHGQRRAMLGFTGRVVPVAMTVTADGVAAGTVHGRLAVQPILVGAKLVTAGALAVVALVVAGLVGGLTWLSVGSTPGLPPTPNPAAATRQIEAVTQNLRTLIVVAPSAQVSGPQEEAGTAGGAEAPPLPTLADPSAFFQKDTPQTTTEPISYQAMFQEIAREYGLSWQILAAQAYVESRLDPLAVGRDGDMGLMQIIPSTWGEWAAKAGVDTQTPYDGYANAKVGAAYLAYLRAELAKNGHPEDAWALAAYNWGLRNVRDVLAGGQGWDGLPKKQRQYVTDILNLAGSIGE